MLRLKEILLTLVLCTIVNHSLLAQWITISQQGIPINYTWLENGNATLDQEEIVFKLAFRAHNENNVLRTSSSFEKEKNRFKEKNSQDHFLSARTGNIVVGYASFQELEDNKVLINYAVIHPLCQKQGIGRELVFGILKKLPSTKMIIVNPKQDNHKAQAFYTKLGFISGEHWGEAVYHTQAQWTFVSKKNRLLSFSWIESGNMREEELVFLAAFKHIYKPLTKQELPPREYLENFLQDAFNEEKKLLNNKSENDFFISAKDTTCTVGYISFSCTSDPSVMYINQLAVLPSYWHQGIGRELVFSILKARPTTKKIVVVTRKVNVGSRKFYERIGFTPSTFSHEGSDPDIYTGYEYIC